MFVVREVQKWQLTIKSRLLTHLKDLRDGMNTFLVCLFRPHACKFCAKDVIPKKLKKKIKHEHDYSFELFSGGIVWYCNSCNACQTIFEDSSG